MFGNNKKPSNQNATTPGSSSINSLVSGTKISGTLTADSDIRIDGIIEGDLICKGRVIIGPSGKISGEVKCQNAVIEGTFEGTLEVNDVLDIRETGAVNGQVNTGKLVIAPGGVFNVNCNMNGQKIKSISPPLEAEA